MPRALSRSIRALVLALAVGAPLLATGCGGDGAESGSDPGVSAEAPDGAALYQRSCALCHGNDLRGTAMGPSHLSEVYEPGHHSDASFVAAIKEGSPAHHWDFGDMPPVEGLSDDEIEAIIAFIRAKQESEGFEPYPPADS